LFGWFVVLVGGAAAPHCPVPSLVMVWKQLAAGKEALSICDLFFLSFAYLDVPFPPLVLLVPCTELRVFIMDYFLPI
jgi:hypothetical protein